MSSDGFESTGIQFVSNILEFKWWAMEVSNVCPSVCKTESLQKEVVWSNELFNPASLSRITHAKVAPVSP